MNQQTNGNLPAPIVQNMANVSAGLANIVVSAAIAAATSVAGGAVRSLYLTIYDTCVEIKVATEIRSIDGRIYRFETIADRYNTAITRAQGLNHYSSTVQQVLLQALEDDLKRQMEKVLRSA